MAFATVKATPKAGNNEPVLALIVLLYKSYSVALVLAIANVPNVEETFEECGQNIAPMDC